MSEAWDTEGVAQAALGQAVEGFGPAILGRADLLDGVLRDDAPGLDREITALTAAARLGVPALLADLAGEGLSDAALAGVASDLAARGGLDGAGARWAVRAVARALGLVVPAAKDQVAAPPPAGWRGARPAGGDPAQTQSVAVTAPANQRTAGKTVRQPAGLTRLTIAAQVVSIAAGIAAIISAYALGRKYNNVQYFAAGSTTTAKLFLILCLVVPFAGIIAAVAALSLRGRVRWPGYVQIASWIAVLACGVAVFSTTRAVFDFLADRKGLVGILLAGDIPVVIAIALLALSLRRKPVRTIAPLAGSGRFRANGRAVRETERPCGAGGPSR